MNRRRFLSSLFALRYLPPTSLSSSGAGPGAQPLDALTAPDVPAIRQRLAAWLASSGLGDMLETEKLRWAVRPDAAVGDDRRWLQWELRFAGTETDAVVEHKRFVDFIQQYKRVPDIDFAEAVFYKLVHEAGVRRADAAAYVFVLDQSYVIRFDAVPQRVILAPEDARNVRFRVDLPALDGAGGLRGSLSPPRRPEDLAMRIQGFLREYFRTAAPAEVQALPLETDFAGLNVAGIRGRVVTRSRYWERLQIGIEIKSGTAPISVACIVDGQYAAGLGSTPPAIEAYADMQPKYNAELSAFVQTMLRDLQNALSKAP